MTPNREQPFYAALGQRIRQARLRAGMTQTALGDRLGVTGKAVCQWETGVHRMTVWNYERLRKILGGEW